MPVLIDDPRGSRPSGVEIMIDCSGGTVIFFLASKKPLLFLYKHTYITVFHPSPLMDVFPFSVLL